MANKHLNTKNLMTAFAVSHMTIHHWRKGSNSKYPLPTVAVKDQPNAVAFSLPQVKAWAKQNKVELVVNLESLIGTAEVKPGPKAKAKAKAPAKAVAVTKKTSKGVVEAGKVSANKIAALDAALKAKAKPAVKKASPLKGTKVSAKPTEAKQPRLRVVPVEAQQAA